MPCRKTPREAGQLGRVVATGLAERVSASVELRPRSTLLTRSHEAPIFRGELKNTTINQAHQVSCKRA
jgi:hypothetical protein